MHTLTAFGLPRVVPVDVLGALAVERDGDDRTLRVGVRREAVRGVGDLRLHPSTVVTLRQAISEGGGGQWLSDGNCKIYTRRSSQVVHCDWRVRRQTLP